jgi:CO/xanthine dehydrogenase Mo-binding subunit
MIQALDNDAAAQAGRRAVDGRFDRDTTFRAIEGAERQFSWTYEVPFLAHAALEPLCATAIVREDEVEVWAPTQQPDRARDAIAEVTGRPREQVRLHVTFLGGGFGRKWENDFVRQAAEIAKYRPGVPIKLTWSREEDTRHDRFRPAHTVRTRVGVDAKGQILGMHSRTTGISMWRYQGRRPIPGRADPFVVGMLINEKYAFDNQYVDYVETPEPIPVGTWRSVSQSQNGFFSESAIDDVAYATGQDPLALRLQLAAGDPRAVRVLRKAAEAANWGAPLPKGRGRGIALSLGYDSYCAEVIEVSVDDAKRVTIERIIATFDCGQIIDPHNVEAQVSGGIVWGLSAAIHGQIRFTQGAAVESNFHDAPILRLNEIPPIEVILLESDAASGGAGEASVPGVAPALASAIQAACGERPRRLPIIESGFSLGVPA